MYSQVCVCLKSLVLKCIFFYILNTFDVLAHNLVLSNYHYFTVSHQIFYRGSAHTDSDNNYEISGVGSQNDCFVLALARNSGDKIAFR